ncbi:BrnT family toxin [Rhodanobacter spathiphylli]|uniref:BrnT family toxin n=1 Tax=Rhodanobacter spathiphylli TaxID=347483 RepID=UPI003CCDC3C7
MGRRQGGTQSAQARHRVRGRCVRFSRPWRIDVVDDRDDYGEERWLSIGWVSPVLLVVAHTERGVHGEVIRIISARKANAQERAFYHEAQT